MSAVAHESTPADGRMDPRIKALWINELRSGRYGQGTQYLHARTEDGETYCCLGVLCEIAVQEGVIIPGRFVSNRMYSSAHYAYWEAEDEEEQLLPRKVADWAGLQVEPYVKVERQGGGCEEGAADCNCDTYPKSEHVSLAELNDGGTSFAMIADLIEESL